MKTKKIRFEDFILMESYYLTTLDYWLLLQRHKIPAFFISSKFLMETNYEKNEFVAYGTPEDKFAFIVVPGLRSTSSPNYKLIQDKVQGEMEEKKTFFSLNELKNSGKLVASLNDKISIEDYLIHFVKPKTTRIQKKPDVILQIIDDEEKE